jgi:hypothetical protein
MVHIQKSVVYKLQDPSRCFSGKCISKNLFFTKCTPFSQFFVISLITENSYITSFQVLLILLSMQYDN